MNELYYNIINYGSLYHYLNITKNYDIYNYIKDSNNLKYISIYENIINKTLSDDLFLNIKSHVNTNHTNISTNLIIQEMLDPANINLKFVNKLLKYFSLIYNTSYWNIIKDLYYDYLLKFNIHNYSVYINQLLCIYFPSIKKIDSTYTNLFKLSNTEIAYYLGYNINIYIPNTEILLNDIFSINFNNIRNINKNYINTIKTFYNKNIINSINEEGEYINSYYEEIINYNFYDVKLFIYDNFIYLYTVDEFSNLISTKKHFINRLPIDNHHLNILKNHVLIGNSTLISNINTLLSCPTHSPI